MLLLFLFFPLSSLVRHLYAGVLFRQNWRKVWRKEVENDFKARYIFAFVLILGLREKCEWMEIFFFMWLNWASFVQKTIEAWAINHLLRSTLLYMTNEKSKRKNMHRINFALFNFFPSFSLFFVHVRNHFELKIFCLVLHSSDKSNTNKNVLVSTK